MKPLTDIERKTVFVLTGDVAGYTKIPPAQRKRVISDLMVVINSWPEGRDSRVFRGDSFQMMFLDFRSALLCCLQIRCWLKKYPVGGNIMLDARVAIGAGKVDYLGKSVLDSDGQAFHLSGRGLESMTKGKFMKIVTPDPVLNSQFEVFCLLMDGRISRWTRGQAEAIFGIIEGKTQQEIATELCVGQSAINNKLRLSHWKEFERVIEYFASLLE